MKKVFAVILALILSVSMAACGEGEETTLTGMVVSVDGTKITLMEMDTANMGGMDISGGGQFQMPEGMDGSQGFGNFNFEDFTMPQDGEMPQWGNGEMPEGMTPPEGMDGMTMPEDMTLPEGMGDMMPGFGGSNGGMPNFGGGNGGTGSGFVNFASEAETKELDIGDAHISVEIDGGKESGSMANIQPGTFVTVTVNGKGKATYVLVSSQTGFGGSRRPAK